MTAPAVECTHCHTPVPSGIRYCLVCGVDVSEPGAVPPSRPAIAVLKERLAGVLADRYTITRTLGVGGMGAVFLAVETELDREVAIKVLPPRLAEDPSVVARFEREARTAARLDHAHIIPIYRVESEGDLHYFVMKYVAGRPLDALITSRGPLPVPQVVRILSESAAALEHAHKKGVVHRDIKPANILLDQEDRVLLADFGIAKAVEGNAELTNSGVVIGTPYYMSPEQALGSAVDGRSDQYSLAVVGYRMLTGEALFEGDASMAILYKHIHQPPPRVRARRADVPEHIELALLRALAKAPEGRFKSMTAFARAIRGEDPVTELRESATEASAGAALALSNAATEVLEKTPVPSRRRITRRVTAVGLVGLLVASGYWWAQGQRAVPPPAAPDSTVDTTRRAAAPVSAPRDTVTPPAQTPRPAPRQSVAAPVRPADTSTAPVVFASAPLTVDATPFGTLFIDDVRIGGTPVVGHALAPGDHTLRVEREGCQAREERITVATAAPIKRQYTLACAP